MRTLEQIKLQRKIVILSKIPHLGRDIVQVLLHLERNKIVRIEKTFYADLPRLRHSTIVNFDANLIVDFVASRMRHGFEICKY